MNRAGTVEMILPRGGLRAVLLSLSLAAPPALAQLPQNPSPMVEHTRSHPRLEREALPGDRFDLSVGELFVPEALADEGRVDAALLVHFHGAPFVAERAVAKSGGAASLAVQLGSGSGVYAKAFGDPGRFGALLDEAEREAGLRFDRVAISGWSAGCGAVREILRVPANVGRVGTAILIDGIHAGYRDGKPGPQESELVTAPLAPLVGFARLALEGERRMLVTHSEVFPGTYASTTETADWLVRELGVERKAVLRWGPMGTQQLSEVVAGGFLMAGFAGNSAPDHVDQLHALPDFLAGLTRDP